MDISGKILLASPTIADSAFSNSIIYVRTDSPNSIIGFAINLRMDADISELWSKEINWEYPSQIHHGGPINAQSGYILHGNDYASTATTEIDNGLYYTTGTSIIEDINADRGPKEFSLLVGFCKWKKAQLEDEIANGMWYLIDYDRELLFNGLAGKEAWDFAVKISAKHKTDKILDV